MISAFSLSTSTTARRIGTTQSGSKLALSSRALPKRRHLPDQDGLRSGRPVVFGGESTGALSCTSRDTRPGRGGRDARRRRTGSRSGTAGTRDRAAGGTVPASTTAGGRAPAPDAPRATKVAAAPARARWPATRTTGGATTGRATGATARASCVRTVPARHPDPADTTRLTQDARGPLVPS